MKPNSKKVSLFIPLLCAYFLLFLPLALAAEETKDTKTITILTVNDFHGAMIEAGKNPGAAKLVGYVKAEAAKNLAGTILLSAGDMFQGSPDSNLLYGKPVVAIMNEAGFAAMTLGNHEFDWGNQVLIERINQANFPFVAANVMDKTTGKPVSFVKPYTLLEKKELKIAIIGLTTPETAYKTNPVYSKNFIFCDPAKTVKELVPLLKQQGTDIIVVLSHMGSEMDAANEIKGEVADLALNTEGVDAIVSGHTHQRVAGMVNSVPIVQAAYNGRAVGKIVLTFSENAHKVVAAEAAVVDLVAKDLVADAAVQDITRKAQNEVAPVKDIILGYTKKELSHNKASVSTLGQWVTDVMRRTMKADIAFQNGGGLRTSIPAGNITIGNLYEVVPFDNTLVTLELTGKQIKENLEYGIYNKQIGMLQFSGLVVKYDKSQPEGKRVVEVSLHNGRRLDLNKTYKVVTNDFLAQGGDGFTTFTQGKYINDSQIPLRNLLMDAVKAAGKIDIVTDNRFQDIKPAGNIEKPAA